jgi:tetratricopeptide (TPR) repeat protein
VNINLGQLAQTRGDYRQSAEVFSRVAETLQGHRRYRWRSVFLLALLVWSLAELGEFTEATVQGEEALRIAHEGDQATRLVYAYLSLGFVSLRRGAIPQAIPPLERAVEVCRAAEMRVLFDSTVAHLGYAYALSGRLQEGVALI